MAEIRTPDVDDLLSVLGRPRRSRCYFRASGRPVHRARDSRDVPAPGRGASFGGGEVLCGHRGGNGASATTIARVSKCLSYGAGGYEQALKILDARP